MHHSPLSYHGTGVAVPTMRLPDGSIDGFVQYALHARLVARGCSMLLVAGTTGRGSTCSIDDRIDLATSARDAGGSVVVVGSDSRVAPRDLARLAEVADGLLVAFPAGTMFSDVVTLRDALEARECDLLVYHHPARHDPMPSSWDAGCAAAGIAVKNSDPDLGRMGHMLEHGVHVLAGSTTLLGTPGSAGALSGLGSILYELVDEAVRGGAAARAALLAYEAAIAGDRIGHVERRVRDLCNHGVPQAG